VSAVLKAFANFGRPKKLSLEEIKIWSGRVLNATDSQYGLMALMFMKQPPTKLIFIPATVLAAYHVAVYLKNMMGHTALWRKLGVKIFQYMASRKASHLDYLRTNSCIGLQNEALRLNAVAEIFVGMVLVAQVFTPMRNAFGLILYWKLLKTRYWSPDSATIHREVYFESEFLSKEGRRCGPAWDGGLTQC